MGQKVNPHGLRVGVIKDWDSRWFADKKNFGATLVEDYNLRKTLKKQLYNFGISKIEIERDGKRVRISIHCAKPGLVIGKGGAEIEKALSSERAAPRSKSSRSSARRCLTSPSLSTSLK